MGLDMAFGRGLSGCGHDFWAWLGWVWAWLEWCGNEFWAWLERVWAWVEIVEFMSNNL